MCKFAIIINLSAAKMLYYIIYQGRQYGPMEKSALRRYGLNANSQVWHEGLPSWVSASQVPDLAGMFPPPLPGEEPSAVDYTANRHTPSTPEVPAGYRHVNWLALSIIVTVVGFFTTCVVGGIVGIIAIVNANKANSMHEMGQYVEAQKASSTAKSCVIIGWVIAALAFFAMGCTHVIDELYNSTHLYGI